MTGYAELREAACNSAVRAGVSAAKGEGLVDTMGAPERLPLLLDASMTNSG